MSASSMNASLLNGITKTISITSGKGGVGKTTITANLAYQLGQSGKRVLVLDGDWGMSNVDIMFGVRPEYSIENVMSGEMSLNDIVVEASKNVFLIPGGSGIYELQKVNELQKSMLLYQVSQMEGLFDYMIIDTAPGIDDKVLYLNSAAQEIMVVLTPDPASLADAYALIKVLNTRHKETKFSVLCNFAKDEKEALKVFKKLSDVTSRFLYVSLDYKGYIPLDNNLRRATKTQQLIMRADPKSEAGIAISGLSEKISGFSHIKEVKGGIQFFWEQLVGVA